MLNQKTLSTSEWKYWTCADTNLNSLWQKYNNSPYTSPLHGVWELQCLTKKFDFWGVFIQNTNPNVIIKASIFKVSSHQKLVFRSGVWFLFVLTDSISLNLNLQKRKLYKFLFSTVYTFVQHFCTIDPKFGDVFCVFGLFWYLANIRATIFTYSSRV